MLNNLFIVVDFVKAMNERDIMPGAHNQGDTNRMDLRHVLDSFIRFTQKDTKGIEKFELSNLNNIHINQSSNSDNASKATSHKPSNTAVERVYRYIVTNILLLDILINKSNQNINNNAELMYQKGAVFDRFFHPSTISVSVSLRILLDIIKNPAKELQVEYSFDDEEEMKMISNLWSNKPQKREISSKDVDIVRIEATRQLEMLLVNNNGYQSLIYQCGDDEALKKHMPSMVGSIPDVIANAFEWIPGKSRDDIASYLLDKAEFFGFISQESVDMLHSHIVNITNPIAQQSMKLALISMLVKLCRIGFVDLVIETMFSFIFKNQQKYGKGEENEKSIWHTLLIELSKVSFIDQIVPCILVRLTFLALRDGRKYKLKLLQDTIFQKRTLDESQFLSNTLKNRILLVHILPPETLRLLMDFLFVAFTKEDMIESSLHVTNVWAEKGFIHRVDNQLHAYVTGVIRGFIFRLSKDDIEKSGLLLQLVHGVSEHIESSVPSTRRLGMIVGEEFSRTIDPENPLKFDELHDSQIDVIDDFKCTLQGPDVETEILIYTGSDNAYNESNPAKQNPIDNLQNPIDIAGFNLEQQLQQNEDAWYMYESDDDEDSNKKPKRKHIYPTAQTKIFDITEEDDDIDLIPYADDYAPKQINTSTKAKSLEDISFSKKHLKPIYLHDAFQMLGSDSYEQFVLALDSIDDLIRAKPSDINQLASQIVDGLLNLQNKYNLPYFGLKRIQALVSLVVNAPFQSLPVLFSRLHTRNSGLGIRLDILDILVQSAKEMSSGKIYNGNTSSKDGEDDDVPQLLISDATSISVGKTAVNYKESTPSLKPLGMTKWKSKSIGKKQKDQTINEFLPLTPFFFYPLFLQDVPSTVPERNRWEDSFDAITVKDNKYPTLPSVKSRITYSRTKTMLTNITTSDPILLARFVLCAGAILECSKDAPDIISMANTMLDLLKHIRHRPEHEIRRAAIYAYATIFSVMPPSILFDNHEPGSFRDDVYEISLWFKIVMESDPDYICRNQAETLFKFCLKSMNM